MHVCRVAFDFNDFLHWSLFLFTSARSIVNLLNMFRMKLVSRVACFTYLDCRRVACPGSACTVPFAFLRLILIRCFIHEIYFCAVVPIDFVLQPRFQHVEDSRLQALFQFSRSDH